MWSVPASPELRRNWSPSGACPFTRTTRLVQRLALPPARARAAAERRADATALRDGRRTTSIWPERRRLPLMPFIARNCATETPLRRATLASDSPGPDPNPLRDQRSARTAIAGNRGIRHIPRTRHREQRRNPHHGAGADAATPIVGQLRVHPSQRSHRDPGVIGDRLGAAQARDPLCAPALPLMIRQCIERRVEAGPGPHRHANLRDFIRRRHTAQEVRIEIPELVEPDTRGLRNRAQGVPPTTFTESYSNAGSVSTRRPYRAGSFATIAAAINFGT